MTTPADGLYNIISALDPSISTGWVLRVGGFTEEPDAQIVFIDTGGRAPEVSVGIDYPTVQVLARHHDYGVVAAKIREVRDALHFIPQNPEAYSELTSCVVRTEPMSIGKDKNDRFRFTMNLNLIVTPANPGYRQ